MRKTVSRIRDGHYYTCVIPAVSGEYGELEIEYRPLLAEEVSAVAEKVDNTETYHAAIREKMAQHIVAWSEWDETKAEHVPITADAFKALPQGLFWACWNALYSAVEVEEEAKN